MAKRKSQPDTRTPEEKQGHTDLIQAGINFHNISSMGDTSQIPHQAAGLENYAIMQGLDPETDLNGLPRQVKLFGELIPEEQENAKQKLLEVTENNFAYALNGLNNQVAVGLAAKLGTPKEELILGKKLSDPKADLEEIKKSFTDIYEPSSLFSSYVALNTNREEVVRAAYGALERGNRRRQSEFTYARGDKTIVYEGRKAKAYIEESIESANEEMVNETKIGIGSHLAMNIMKKQQERIAREQQNQSE
jgi:hypothetical protein